MRISVWQLLLLEMTATTAFTTSLSQSTWCKRSSCATRSTAFTTRVPNQFTRTTLFESPDVVVNDIGEALEAIEHPLSVEEAIESLEHSQDVKETDDSEDHVHVIIQSAESDTCAIDYSSKEEKAGEIISSLTPKEADRTELKDREAAISASLYMNPATGKIASNLVVTWEPAVAEILDRMTRLSNPNRPFLVGLVGIPGSGKSTSAEIVTSLLGSVNGDEDDERSIVMPMDGYHLPLKTLAESDNAADLIYRRGAPDTFDPASLYDAICEIAYGSNETVTMPGFDHAVGDPVPNQHTFVRSKHKTVIVEGIYLLHDADGWEIMKRLFDWTIYIDADIDACIERLKIRNQCIPGYTPEEIAKRCDIVDRRNAEMSRDSARKYASQIVKSGAS